MNIPEDMVANIRLNFHIRATYNPLCERVIDRHTTLTREVDEIFYFFNGMRQYVQSFVRPPRLVEGHNERLACLADAMDGISVLVPQEQMLYGELSGRIEEFRAAFPGHPDPPILQQLETLGGSVHIHDLCAESLQEYLNQRTRKNFALASAFALGCAYPAGGLAAAVFRWTARGAAVGGFVWNKRRYELPTSIALREKAARISDIVDYAL